MRSSVKSLVRGVTPSVVFSNSTLPVLSVIVVLKNRSVPTWPVLAMVIVSLSVVSKEIAPADWFPSRIRPVLPGKINATKRFVPDPVTGKPVNTPRSLN